MLGKLVFFSLLVLVLQHVIRLFLLIGTFKTIYTHYPGKCRQVPGIEVGSEDFETLENGLTFITAGFRFNEMPPEAVKYFEEKKRKGRLFLFDFNQPEKNVQELIITSTKTFDRDTFNPHGLSLWEDTKTKRILLFVVSHRPGQSDCVEKFLYLPDKLRVQHLKTYQSEIMRVMNDVAATGEDSFYFTNYFYWTSQTLQLLESVLMLHVGEVGLYDGQTYQIVAVKIAAANGISLSKDKKFVYVAAGMDKQMQIYRKESNGGLTYVKAWFFDLYLDNFAIQPETGDVYVTGHPNALKYLDHHENPRNVTAPSQVLHVKMNGENVTDIRELFVDATGELISGSSVALAYKNKLLIGSVMHNLVICDINIPL